MSAVRPFALPLLTFALLTYGASVVRAHALASDQSAPRADAAVSPRTLLTDLDQEPPCPPGALLDDDVCVRWPEASDEDDAPGETALAVANMHRERSGRWAAYEQIPRRPDRPANYGAYRYPVVTPGGGHPVVSGYDLDLPDADQRRGRTLHAVGHGGVDLPQPRGTRVELLRLEHQEGEADVLYVGPLFGTTVVTRQTVREADRLRDYVVLFGHLDAPAAGLRAGSVLKEGDLVGFVGDTGSPELVHLHLETRRVRDGVDIAKRARESPGALVQDAVSVVCDPRNVLPLRSPVLVSNPAHGLR